MTNTTAIRYELLRDTGLRTVCGEHVDIPNLAGAAFGIHAEPLLPDGHYEKWIVTHLASGMMAGAGATPGAAIKQATANCERNRDRLRDMLDDATATRTDIQFAASQLQHNCLTTFPEKRA
ncbi:hypothetical protein TN889_07250 [Burkholderia gladioli pv. alliicola]|uniref:hypothetical protein n=1 Tax=Burkholderia gladioli TaxID=28095 RepID=UPI002AB8EB67|nr:hypothetical protein [Burkholderia gladioli]MDZ4036179.1 hypothetical protein [Burkholderia gladioli pv. alliicola]